MIVGRLFTANESVEARRAHLRQGDLGLPQMCAFAEVEVDGVDRLAIGHDVACLCEVAALRLDMREGLGRSAKRDHTFTMRRSSVEAARSDRDLRQRQWPRIDEVDGPATMLLVIDK